MNSKMAKIFVATVLSIVFMVGAVSSVQAASGARACSHDYFLEEDYWVDYVDRNDGDFHEVYEWQERYCMDCGAYFYHLRSYIEYEMHSGPVGGHCVDCAGLIY